MRTIKLMALAVLAACVAGCPFVVSGDVTVPTTNCVDDDGDGFTTFGDMGGCGTASDCSGEILDCNDTDPAIYPGAEEVCDGVDNNCDGVIDECGPRLNACSFGQWDDTCMCQTIVENDCIPCSGDFDCNDGAIICQNLGMGVGVYAQYNVCVSGRCEVEVQGCMDANICYDTCSDGVGCVKRPIEVCDGVDNDCDGETDEDEHCEGCHCVDNDSDGFFLCFYDHAYGCGQPELDGTQDCNDTNAAIHPGAEEVCDGVDNNCDGHIDSFYADADGVFDSEDDLLAGICDDHNACTDAVCLGGLCQYEQLVCEDGLACNPENGDCEVSE